jgi:hypothetical protein
MQEATYISLWLTHGAGACIFVRHYFLFIYWLKTTCPLFPVALHCGYEMAIYSLLPEYCTSKSYYDMSMSVCCSSHSDNAPLWVGCIQNICHLHITPLHVGISVSMALLTVTVTGSQDVSGLDVWSCLSGVYLCLSRTVMSLWWLWCPWCGNAPRQPWA